MTSKAARENWSNIQTSVFPSTIVPRCLSKILAVELKEPIRSLRLLKKRNLVSRKLSKLSKLAVFKCQTQINLLAMKGWVQYDTPFLPRLIVHIGNQSSTKKSMTQANWWNLQRMTGVFEFCCSAYDMIQRDLADKFANFWSLKNAFRQKVPPCSTVNYHLLVMWGSGSGEDNDGSGTYWERTWKILCFARC